MKELTIVHALCVTRLKVGNEHAFHKTFIVCIGFRVRVTEINVDISCLMELRSQFHRAQRSSFKVQEISFTEEGRQNAKKTLCKTFYLSNRGNRQGREERKHPVKHGRSRTIEKQRKQRGGFTKQIIKFSDSISRPESCALCYKRLWAKCARFSGQKSSEMGGRVFPQHSCKSCEHDEPNSSC